MEAINATNVYPLLTFLHINGKEYLISFSQNGPIESFDFENDKIYFESNFHIVNKNSAIKKNVFTSLNYYNNSNYILNGFVNKKTNSELLLIIKYFFPTFQISKYNVNFTFLDQGKGNIYSKVSCFEIKDYIECLYGNYSKSYIISIYEISSLENKYSQLISNDLIKADNLFIKCIYIKNNIGAFIYYIEDNSTPFLFFKDLIIKMTSSIFEFELKDYINPITINKNKQFNLGNKCIYNDLIKMDDNNIYYISTDKESENIMIVLIKLLNDDKNILICYYQMKLKQLYNIQIFTDITTFIFNDYLGIGMTHYDYNLNNNINQTYSSFFIIGNSSINNITIPDDIDIFDEDNIYEFKIENLNFSIDNNIFGYIPKGIQILSELNGEILGFNLYSKNLQKNIDLNDIILINDSIIFKIDTNGSKLGNYLFEFIPIISESKFDDFISIFNSVEYYPNNNIDFNPIYKPKIFIGKKSYLSFSISKCYKTCEKCINHGNQINHQCEKCSSKYSYYTLTNNKLDSNINCYESCPNNYVSGDNDEYLCIKKATSSIEVEGEKEKEEEEEEKEEEGKEKEKDEEKEEEKEKEKNEEKEEEKEKEKNEEKEEEKEKEKEKVKEE